MRQVTRKSLMTVAAATGVIAAAGGYAHADSGANGFATDSPGIASGNTVQAPVHVPVNVCGNTIDIVGILNPAFGNSCANTGGGNGSGGNGYGDHGYGDRASGGGKHGGGQSGGHRGDSSGGGGHQGGHSGNQGGGHWGGHGDDGDSGAYPGYGGAQAGGHTGGSPGIGSGNHVQAPIDVPVNVCGNSLDAVGILNPSYGNDCANGGGYDHVTPPTRGHETPGRPGHQNPGKPVGHGSTPSGPEAVPSTPGRGTPAHSVTAHQPTGSTGTVASGAQLAETGSELPLGLALPAGAGALLAGALIYRKARASM
ncbi:chaplin family protein [Streptomyces sp. T028]|uniref:chaplin n=1 Tax=Streptomyces sp. T028 TaxID=3394379 RepID=UPI003A895E33